MKSSILGIAQHKYITYPIRKPRWVQCSVTLSAWYFCSKDKNIITIIDVGRGYYNVRDRYFYHINCGTKYLFKFVIGSIYK